MCSVAAAAVVVVVVVVVSAQLGQHLAQSVGPLLLHDAPKDKPTPPKAKKERHKMHEENKSNFI